MKASDHVLGDLSEASDGSKKARATLSGREVSVSIDASGGDIDVALKLARTVVGSLPEHDQHARDAAALSLLDTCNDSWRDYSQVGPDGQPVEVSLPPIEAEEFVARLKLDAINVKGEECCDFFYDDDYLFWGHSVIVTTFDSCRTWDAQLFG